VSIFDAAAQVDTFEGAYYSRFGIYRPTINSKMRSLDRPFQEVKIEQFVFSLYETVSPIEDAMPLGGAPYSACTVFSVTPVTPVDHALGVQWSIDGTDVLGATGSTFEPDAATLTAGVHMVRVTVADPTSRVRADSYRTALLADTREWPIEAFDLPYCACATLLAPVTIPGDQAKSRYLSIVPGNADGPRRFVSHWPTSRASPATTDARCGWGRRASTPKRIRLSRA